MKPELKAVFNGFEILAFKWFLLDGLHDNKTECKYQVSGLLWNIHAAKMPFILMLPQ